MTINTGRRKARPQTEPGDTIEIAGIQATVVTNAEAETAELMLCANLTIPLILADNRTGPCADCGDILQWRPNAPKKPAKLCMSCATIRVLKESR